MQGVIEQIRLYYPEVASLLNPPVRDENLLDMAQSLDLPDDYYRLYALADGEAEESDGVFGLHRLMPLSESLDGIVTEPRELNDILSNCSYEMFVPVFSTPGRQQLGYAKHREGWDFAEYDIWPSKTTMAALSDFIHSFSEKLRSGGYTTEAGLQGLIDRDEM